MKLDGQAGSTIPTRPGVALIGRWCRLDGEVFKNPHRVGADQFRLRPFDRLGTDQLIDRRLINFLCGRLILRSALRLATRGGSIDRLWADQFRSWPIDRPGADQLIDCGPINFLCGRLIDSGRIN